MANIAWGNEGNLEFVPGVGWVSPTMPGGGQIPTPFGGNMPGSSAPPATQPTTSGTPDSGGTTTPTTGGSPATGAIDPAYLQWLVNNYGTVEANRVISGDRATADKYYNYWLSNVKDNPTGAVVNVPPGYQVVIPNVLFRGPDGKYYDYSIWLDKFQLVEVDDKTATGLLTAYEKEMAGSAGNLPFGGVPEKIQGADGQWWWVYKDTNGNIVKMDMVTDDDKDMTEYEKAQYDLALQRFNFEKEQSMLAKEQADAQKFTSPREWIQRWGQMSPGTLPNATPWMKEFTGLGEHQQISPTAPKLASGQSLARLAPSELQGMYGYVDWAAGRGSPYASGEDWMYESQKLLPQNAPRMTQAWNPNPKV